MRKPPVANLYLSYWGLSRCLDASGLLLRIWLGNLHLIILSVAREKSHHRGQSKANPRQTSSKPASKLRIFTFQKCVVRKDVEVKPETLAGGETIMFKLTITIVTTVLAIAFGGQAITTLTEGLGQQINDLSSISIEGQINDGFDQAWAITSN